MKRKLSWILGAALALMMALPAGAAEAPEAAARLPGAIRVDREAYPVFVDEQGDMLESMVWRGTVYIPLATAAEWMGCTWELDGAVLRLTSGGEPHVRGLDEQPENYAPAFQAMIDACPVEEDQRAEVCPRQDLTVELDGTPRPLVNVLGETTPLIQCFGALYLPIRGVGELMGKQVVWNLHTPDYQVIYLVDPPTEEELAELEDFTASMAALYDQLAGKLADLRADQDSRAAEARLREMDELLVRMAGVNQPTSAFGSFDRRVTQIYLGTAREDVAVLLARLSGQSSYTGISLDVLREHVEHVGRDVACMQSDLTALAG